MPAGRKPKPTSLKLINGNPGKRPINTNEADIEPSIPAPPAFLSTDGREEWDRVVGLLYRCGLMTDVDYGTVAAYCQAFGRWVQAERALARMAEKDKVNAGLIIRTSNGNAIQNPLVGVANKAHNDVVRYSSELGMTPSSRSRVNALPASSGNKFQNNGRPDARLRKGR